MVEKNFWLTVVTIIVLALLIIGYWYGQYRANLAADQQRSVTDQQVRRLEAALQQSRQRASSEAAKAAAEAVRTFKVDAFAQAKEALNPFK